MYTDSREDAFEDVASFDARTGAPQIPATVAEARKRARVIGDQRKRPLPVSSDYIHISIHDDFTAERFNGVANLITQSAEIVGVTLIWDDLDHDSPLRSFDKRLDLRNLTIYADRVVFRSEHRFYRTNVTIYARELVFEEEGCINTMPRAQAPAPFTKRDAEGYPPNYKVLDGQTGEPAGTVMIHAQDVIVAPDAHIKDARGHQPPQRIVTTGQRGQDGEKGGLKRYTPGKSDVPQPAAKDGKKLNTITLDDIKKKLGDLHHVPSAFEYPDYSAENVVSVSVVAYVPVWPAPILDQFFLPGPSQLFATRLIRLGVPDFGFWWSSQYGLRPGDPEEPYPSGTPGEGGRGGDVTLNYHRQCPATFDAVCDTHGGEGGESPGVDGVPPGEPLRARHAILLIVRSDAVGDKPFQRRPFVEYRNVSSGRWSTSLPSQTGHAGGDGDKAVQKTAQPTWLHPLVLDAVIGYARDAFRAGYRQDAEKALNHYRERLSAGDLPADVASKRSTVLGLLNNLDNNLDFYGNNIGWVPRLNATTSFEFFQREGTNASRLLYFADTLAKKWTTLKRTSEAANHASAALGDELDYAQEALVHANTDFDDALKDVKRIDEDLQQAQRDFKKVFDRLTGIAQQHEQVKDLVKGMCKFAGGLAKVVPVGQPYLGLAGDVVTELGDFEWTDADGAFTWDQVASNFEGFGKKLGKTVDTFRETHRDLLIKDELEPGQQSLKQKIKDAKGAIKNLDSEVDTVNAEIEKKWIELRDGELVGIRNRIKSIDEQLAKQPEQPVLVKEQLTLKEELAKRATERLQAAKVRLESELANKTGALEKQDLERKTSLRDKIDALQAEKATKQKGIESLRKKEALRETKTKDAFDAMAGIGDGIASMGAGITGMFAKVDPDNPKVKALLENVKTSALFDDALKKDYFALQESLEAIGVRKNDAVSKLLGVQQSIVQNTAAITSGLSEMVALGRQRQALDEVVRIETLQHLHGMRERAKERLHGYLYEFIKAYQYQYLIDVPSTFYDYDTWVERLVALESVDADGVRTTPTLDKIKAVEKDILTSDYLQMARAIVLDRQKRAGASANSYTCKLNATQLEKLLTKGHLTFNLLYDFNTNATLAMQDARIEEISLTTFAFTPAKGSGSFNLNIMFEHSGKSILLDGQGQYWFFQKGATDDPIRWRYVWKPGKLEGDTVIKGDALLDALLKGDEVTFREHRPGLLSNVTLWINKDATEPLTRYVAAFTKVMFNVKFVYR
jgi:hypothetical protein